MIKTLTEGFLVIRNDIRQMKRRYKELIMEYIKETMNEESDGCVFCNRKIDEEYCRTCRVLKDLCRSIFKDNRRSLILKKIDLIPEETNSRREAPECRVVCEECSINIHGERIQIGGEVVAKEGVPHTLVCLEDLMANSINSLDVISIKRAAEEKRRREWNREMIRRMVGYKLEIVNEQIAQTVANYNCAVESGEFGDAMQFEKIYAGLWEYKIRLVERQTKE